MENKSTFGERLRQARNSVNMTAKEVASSIGVSYPSYMAYENQGREPKQETLAKLSDVLHVSIDYLIKGTNEKWIDIVSNGVYIEYPKGCDLSDIAPIIKKLEYMISSDKNANYQKRKLDDNARKAIFLDISLIKSHALFPPGDEQIKVVDNANYDTYLGTMARFLKKGTFKDNKEIERMIKRLLIDANYSTGKQSD